MIGLTLKTVVQAGILALLALTITPAGTFAKTPTTADYTKPYQREALEMFRKAISMRTALGHGQVPAFAAYLAEQLKAAGFPDRDVTVIPHTLVAGEATAMLVARLPGDGSLEAKPILFLAHMDVVDAYPKTWERDPFTLVEEDGYFFGRGTSDNKQGVVALVSAFMRLKRDGFTPRRDLILALTGDEETAMETTQALATTHRALIDAEYALNADAGGGELDAETGEAKVLGLQAAEKTYATFVLETKNEGGHSAYPRPDNAIYALAAALTKLGAYTFPTEFNGVTRTYFEASKTLESPARAALIEALLANPEDPEVIAGLKLNPDLNGVTRTTCVATMLDGGHAENALPRTASATVNCRIFPGTPVETIRERLVSVIDNEAVRVWVKSSGLTTEASPLRDDVMGAVEQSITAVYPGVKVIPYMAPYATDGYHMRANGIPTYGAMAIMFKPGDMRAHGLNERVPVRGFFDELDHWVFLMKTLGAPSNTE